MINRAIIIILDSAGIGELPDAAEYGDTGTNTIAHIAETVGGLRLPNMQRMGLGNIAPILGVDRTDTPAACFGKMAISGKGKDTTIGHWELMGVITQIPFPTYPHGFPPELITDFERRIGLKTIGNKPASGTQIINELGEEHVRTGSPIVYTSADSVFQIAAHEEVIPIEEQYRICKIAREMLNAPPHNIERVIARPFLGEPGNYERTERRRDFSLPPTGVTLLDAITHAGREVIAIGKIEDIFAHRGISVSNHTGNNHTSTEATIAAIADPRGALIFTNLVDFDTLYGHRNDCAGYARALAEFDAEIPRITDAMRDDDLLIITADHGCDPTTPGTDHTREYVPILAYGKWMRTGSDIGTRATQSDLAATLAETLGIDHIFPGASFANALQI